jgi:hypothetical protein
MTRSYDYKRLVADIKKSPTRRKYQHAFLALAKLLQADYIPISHGSHNDDGEICLYWDIKTHYCDIQVNPSCASFSVYVRQRSSEGIQPKKEWYFENVTLAEFNEDWFTRFIEPFKRKDHEKV